jgi:K+-sensing histidine kinase KdpD
MRVHHGSIRASNREQGGACLSIMLPLGEHPPLPPSAEEEFDYE